MYLQIAWTEKKKRCVRRHIADINCFSDTIEEFLMLTKQQQNIFSRVIKIIIHSLVCWWFVYQFFFYHLLLQLFRLIKYLDLALSSYYFSMLAFCGSTFSEKQNIFSHVNERFIYSLVCWWFKDQPFI